MNKVRYGAKNIFNLGTDKFDIQSSSETEAISYAEKKNVYGEEICAKPEDELLNVEATYTYIGNDLINDLKNTITLGGLLEAFLVTAVTITFSNTAQVQISITAHKHLKGNGHVPGFSVLSVYEIDLSKIFSTVPDCIGVPVDGPLGNTNPDATARSMSVNFICNHNDIDSNLGVHKCGHNFNGRVNVTVSYIGKPEIILPEGWRLTSKPFRTSNSSFEITEISAYKSLDRIAV